MNHWLRLYDAKLSKSQHYRPALPSLRSKNRNQHFQCRPDPLFDPCLMLRLRSWSCKTTDDTTIVMMVQMIAGRMMLANICIFWFRTHFHSRPTFLWSRVPASTTNNNAPTPLPAAPPEPSAPPPSSSSFVAHPTWDTMRHDNPRHGLGRLLAVVAEDLIGSTCSGLIFTRLLFNIKSISTTIVMIIHVTVIVVWIL